MILKNLTRTIVLSFAFLSLYPLNGLANQSKKVGSQTRLEQTFTHIPDSIQTSIYWYWMSDNISKEGVVKDLHAMKSVGINRAFIGNIGYESTPYGKVKLFSDEWWDILHTALKTATELNIEIGIFNSPGWSQSGGPWIKPEQSMRYLSSSEVKVEGGKLFESKLPKPSDDFQDVKVIAFREPKMYNSTLSMLKPTLIGSTKIENIGILIDGDKTTDVKLTGSPSFTLDLESPEDYTVRSLVIFPALRRLNSDVEFQVKKGNDYVTLRKFTIDRNNDNLNVGFKPYGPVSISIPATTSKDFRLIFSNSSGDFGVSEIELSASPKEESYIEKTLAKMFQSPLPYWNEYQWKPQPKTDDPELVINPNELIDISKYMTSDGILKWNAPVGNWVVMRFGMQSTLVQNGPASPQGTGLEVDKMSKQHVKSHFDAFLGEILRRIPAADRKTWKVAVQDSYETGGQNWTDGMLDKFKANYGYDALPYLPVLSGKVVGSPDQSDRFLWDLRRFIADRVAYDYVGGLRDVCKPYGLHTWLENYGHWGFPGEFLQYGGQSDEIGGEFWSEGSLGDIENRAASSCAHIYGKRKVSAESFTAGGRPYQRYPEVMKPRGDRFFTEGINNTLLHVYIEQPSDNQVPGINANFGNEFNRHNTWFSYMDLFTKYLKRCNMMLQQGLYVADAAYFIGEDAPKMTGVTDPALPKGYSYDYINGEVLRDRVKVVGHQLVLPDGMSYNILVLPKLETIRPELLQKIKELVQQGATILGPEPQRSPSLQNYPSADAEVQKLAAELWGDINGTTIRKNAIGNGLVLSGMTMQEALDLLKIIPDVKVRDEDPLLYIHRTTSEGDMYFVSNQSNQILKVNPAFRITGKQPEFWDAVTGNVRSLPEYTQTASTTSVPLKLEPFQSAFILFRQDAVKKKASLAVNFPEPKSQATITSPWHVVFDVKSRGPKNPVLFDKLTDWTLNQNDSIKYYSGTAVYQNDFQIKKAGKNEKIYLNLGEVSVMAKVKVNGLEVGGVWTAPWQLDITNAVKSGKNTVEISVVNNWANRLIGDSKLDPSERKTWTSYPLFQPGDQLQASGLKGPVSIQVVKF